MIAPALTSLANLNSFEEKVLAFPSVLLYLIKTEQYQQIPAIY